MVSRLSYQRTPIGPMIYAVVAVHNRKEITERFLKDLQRQTQSDIKLILVDDGSTDGTADMVRVAWPHADILRGDGKWWWTGSMEQGVRHVLKSANEGDFVLCANNDQLAEPMATEVLIRTSEKYGRAIVGSISKEYENKSKLYDSAYTVNWSTHTYAPVPLREHGEYDGNIDVLTCRMTLVPIEVFWKVNFDSKHFPHYYGDYDLFLQAKKHGFRLILSYDSVIYDIGGASGVEKRGQTLTFRELYRNMFDVRSHSNVIFTLRYIYKNCPSYYYKIKFTVLMFYYYLYLLAKTTLAEVFG